MSKSAARNIEKDGVLINILFFCKALDIKKPVGVEDPIGFMNGIVQRDSLNWDHIAEKVKVLREEYKEKRRVAKKRKQEKEEQSDQELFAQFNRSKPMFRSCLSCDEQFFSKFGNRLCEKCKQGSSNYLS